MYPRIETAYVSFGRLFDGSVPMTIFDERERAFESMFAHDQEMRFLALARRNKLLGLWAAGQLGLSGDNARTYADDLTSNVAAGLTDDHLVKKIRTDFETYGVDGTEERIREKLGELQAQAILKLRTEWHAEH
jgi:hypothetical protein